MPKSNLPTPGSIDSNSLMSRINPTDLAPAAKPFSTYQRPTAIDTPKMPNTNSMLQLSAALSDIQPTLTQATGYTKTIEDERREAEAARISEEMQTKNVKDISQAVEAGILPLGASPALERSVRVNNAKLSGERAYTQMLDNYAKDGAIQVEDDPAKFEVWLSQQLADYDKGALFKDDGSKRFDDLDLFRAKYTESTQSAIHRLRVHHVGQRIQAREVEATETAGNLISTRIAAGISGVIESDRNYAQLAQSIQDVYYGAEGFSTKGSVPRKQANHSIVDAVVAEAVSRGDASILNILDHIQTSHNNYLGKITYAKEKKEHATQAIANIAWQNEERERKKAERRGDGTSTLEGAEEQARIAHERIEQEYEEKRAAKMQAAEEQTRKHAVDTEASVIMQHYQAGKDIFQEGIQTHLKQLSALDPEAAKSWTTWLQHQHNQDKQEAETVAQQHSFVELRAAISTNPSSIDVSEIVRRSNAGMLSGSHVSQLFNELEQSRKDRKQFPVLESPLVNSLRSDLKGASGTDPLSDFGEARLRSNQALADFNLLAVGYLKSHPQASDYELYQAMQPHIEKLARKHNPELNTNLTQEEERPKVQAQVKKAEERQVQLNERDKLAERSTPPTAKELTSLLNGEEKKKLGAVIQRIYRPGTTEKPATEQELQDVLLDVLKPSYRENRKGLSRAVDSLMKEFRESQKRKGK